MPNLGLIISLSIAGVIMISLIIIYNGLINKKNQVDNAFGGMDAQLKKRYDLIPNIVSAVKEYVKHEAETQKTITETRSQSFSDNVAAEGAHELDGTITEIEMLREKSLSEDLSVDDKINMDNMITAKLSGLIVAVEAYPDLKASDNFVHLQETLSDVEIQISYARVIFNEVVTQYNNGIEMFPSNIVAKTMGLRQKSVFVIPETERKNVNVEAMFNA